MNRGRFTIRGERYLSLEAVAECYQVEAAWVWQVYEHGLLGRGEDVGGTIVVAAAMLERMAVIRRLSLLGAADLALVEVLLDEMG
ncbi:MAG: hypothetical protein HY812_07885 [Planctomycetes bacterium]|nr:hypothetical protein [Planctomycetota bacterium]